VAEGKGLLPLRASTSSCSLCTQSPPPPGPCLHGCPQRVRQPSAALPPAHPPLPAARQTQSPHLQPTHSTGERGMGDRHGRGHGCSCLCTAAQQAACSVHHSLPAHLCMQHSLPPHFSTAAAAMQLERGWSSRPQGPPTLVHQRLQLGEQPRHLGGVVLAHDHLLAHVSVGHALLAHLRSQVVRTRVAQRRGAAVQVGCGRAGGAATWSCCRQLW